MPGSTAKTRRVGTGQYETHDGNYRIRLHGYGTGGQWIVTHYVGGDRPWVIVGRHDTKAEALASIPT